MAASMFTASFLFASLIWGSIGMGYFIYGKKQSSLIPMIVGVLMMAASYFCGSAWVMSLVCGALMVAAFVLIRMGY